MLVLARKTSYELAPAVIKPAYRPAVEQRFTVGMPLCIPCAKDVASQPFHRDVWPWLTRGALDAGRSREEYQRWCRRCRRPFYGAYARLHCSERCAELTRAARRDRTRDRDARRCETCAEHFTPPRSDGRYCSPACRQKAYRARRPTPDGAS